MKKQMITKQRITQRVILIVSSFIICHLSFSPARAQVGTWHNYLAYHDVQQIQAANGNDIFVMASNGLYKYNTQDQSIQTYDKTNGLNDTDISNIKWCQQAKRLVVAYSNSNIDLVETNGNIINISDLYTKVITGDKTINAITIDNQYAYLSTGFGILKLNVSDALISETYMLNFDVKAVALSGSNIYALSADGSVWTGNTSNNLIDKANWQQTTTHPSFDEDKTDWNTYYPIVSTLSPGGPKYNYFHRMTVVNKKLYTVGGGWYQMGNFDRPGTVQLLDADKNWTIYQDDFQPAFASTYLNATDIAVDPSNDNHVMVASCAGIFEFLNGKFKYNYTLGNTDYFCAATGDTNPDYVRTDGIVYDKEGNLYCLNSYSNTAIIIRNASGQWSGFMDQSLIDKNNRSMRTMTGSILDRKGRIWFVNAHSDHPSLFCYVPQENTVTKYNKFVNQDGVQLVFSYTYCVCEDLEGNIWLGTEIGPLYLSEDEINDPSKGFIQYKVPRNDGTSYADYLMSGVSISCMAVDKAGRKWFGTNSDGVYLISADNNTQLKHFTERNSKLLNNTIESIAINDDTGEVYFGTAKGLCSYMGDATATNNEMTKDNVYAYPNPVTPDYTGLITITGLTLDADVKILNASGKLIAQGRSNGGTFTWDGCDSEGNRVASGVYMVATATSEGKKGTVCKIAVVR